MPKDRRNEAAHDVRLLSLAYALDEQESARTESARRELLELGPEAIPHVIRQFSAASSWRWYAEVAVLCLAVGLGSMCVYWLADRLAPTDHSSRSLPFSMTLTALLVLVFMRWIRRRQLVRALAVFEDPRIAGPLAEALNCQDRRAVSAARDALIKLLPRLAPADSAHLNHHQMECLCRILGGNDYPMVMAALSALTNVGSSEALPYLAALMSETRWLAKDKDVRDAVLRCYEAVQQRARSQRETDTLLRPAESPQSETLLRPANGAANVEVATLLRPSDNGRA